MADERDDTLVYFSVIFLMIMQDFDELIYIGIIYIHLPIRTALQATCIYFALVKSLRIPGVH